MSVAKSGSQHTVVDLIEKHRPLNNPKALASQLLDKSPPAIFENRVAFSVSEMAFMLGLSPRSVERMIRRGELVVRRIGRRVLIPKNEFEAWLNRKE